MDISTSIRDDGKTQVTVTLSAEEVQEQINAKFKELRRARIPGFRPGKAPRKVLEQAFGGHEAVFADITSDAVNATANKAIDDSDLIFIGDPSFEEADLIVEGEPLSYTLFGDVKPEIEILSTDPVEIKMPPEKATEAEVDKQIEVLREYYYSFETLEDTPAEMGHYVMVEVTCTNSDVKIPGLGGVSRLVELGQGLMPIEFDEGVVGMKAGDSKEFDFEVADQAKYGNFGEGTVHAEVTVKEVRKKVMPELDEDFFQKAGVESLEELRKQMGDAINQQKKAQLPDLKETRCIEALAERVHGEIPQMYIDACREDIFRDFFRQMQQQGTTLDKFLVQNGISADDFRDDVAKEAEEVATQSLALDALFRERGMDLTEEDIDKEFQVVENPEETKKQWLESNRMAYLREACRRSKATQWLVETAVVTIEEDAADAEAE